MIIKDFRELIYMQFTLIYGNKMKYDKNDIEIYQKMIINYSKTSK